MRVNRTTARGRRLRTGKLPISLLDRLLKRYAGHAKRLVIGPSIGIDAAAIDFGDRLLLAKTDPITFVGEDIGTYAVHINVNDIAVMGGTPKWFLATILLPQAHATFKMAETIFADLSRSCKALGITLCGGHTEITHGIDRPIIIGQMLGEVAKHHLVTASRARVGDLLILTKGIAIEGTTVLAREKASELKRTFSARFVQRCKRLIRDPGISVMKDSFIAVRCGTVHAMHDPTEGGLATGLHELAIASQVGLSVEASQIPILPEFQALCDYFGLNPLGVIASGSLLLAVAPQDAKAVQSGLARARIQAAIIGRVTPKRSGLNLIENGKKRPLPLFETDEITKVFLGPPARIRRLRKRKQQK
jgi:hydrogenase expression/formation protein HypE